MYKRFHINTESNLSIEMKQRICVTTNCVKNSIRRPPHRDLCPLRKTFITKISPLMTNKSGLDQSGFLTNYHPNYIPVQTLRVFRHCYFSVKRFTLPNQQRMLYFGWPPIRIRTAGVNYSEYKLLERNRRCLVRFLSRHSLFCVCAIMNPTERNVTFDYNNCLVFEMVNGQNSNELIARFNKKQQQQLLHFITKIQF